MTLEEKIGQLCQYTAGELTGPDARHMDYDKLIAQGQIGSLFNVVGARRDEPLPAHRGGKKPAPHSAAFRL